jgi:hypothetical protein
MEQSEVLPLKRSTSPTGSAALAAPFIRLFHRLWAPVLIACGLVLTLAWMALLGFGLVVLIERAL